MIWRGVLEGDAAGALLEPLTWKYQPEEFEKCQAIGLGERFE